MNRADALKALDAASAAGIQHLYDVFVAGLIARDNPADLAERFRNGLAFHCDAHAKTTAALDDYFRGFAP